MIMLCDESRSAGGRRGHRRRWRLAGESHGELRSLLAPVFAQARSRLTAFAYISALLAERGDRKSCWQLAEQAGHATQRRMQALLAEHAWDWKAALAALQRFILAHLGDPEAIVVLDETAELKKGTKTVGVARQHAGITGQVENCRARRVPGLRHRPRARPVRFPPLPAEGLVRRRGGGSVPASRTTCRSPPSPRWAPR